MLRNSCLTQLWSKNTHQQSEVKVDKKRNLNWNWYLFQLIKCYLFSEMFNELRKNQFDFCMLVHWGLPPFENSSLRGRHLCLIMSKTSDVKRGQTSKPMPRPKLWGQGQGRGQNHETEAKSSGPRPRSRPATRTRGYNAKNIWMKLCPILECLTTSL